jgi:Na+/glutamate symporter
MNSDHASASVLLTHNPFRFAALVCVSLLAGLSIVTLASIELTSRHHPVLGIFVLLGCCLLLATGCVCWAVLGRSSKTSP